MSNATPPPNDARAAAIQAALAELRAEYAEGLPALLADLSAAVEAACASEGGEAVRHLQTLAHRMHGAAGSYGFKGVSAAAATLEVLLAARDDDRAAFDDALRAQVRAAFERTRETAAQELAEVAAASGGGAR
jgi:HPt (histidine-containing phosphotransfer) domain-containing protein